MLLIGITATIIIITYGIRLYCKATNGLCKSKKRLDGKTCLVTGGTSGIGLEISMDLAKRGARVIVACPFEDEGLRAKEKIIKETQNDNVEYKFLNLASFDSVREFSADIINNEERLDILMNNAGVGVPKKLSSDGLNIIMQVNYLGHFLLTILLLPLLKKSGTPSSPSRIVNTNSVLHRAAMLKKAYFENTNSYTIKRLIAYGNSKLCLLLFSRELTKKLSGTNVVINDADPGYVGTGIFLQGGYGRIGRCIQLLFYFLFKTPNDGAQTPLHIALDDEAGNVSGKFFKDCRLQAPSHKACNDSTARWLWEQSVAYVKLSKAELDGSLKEVDK